MTKHHAKLDKLVEFEGFDSIDEMLEAYLFESIGPAICMEDGCEYTAELEHDQDQGWCEFCEKPSMKSAYILAEVI
jgi:hypothetical protein